MSAPFGMTHQAWIRSTKDALAKLDASPAITENGEALRCAGCGDVFHVGEEFALERTGDGRAVHTLCYLFGDFEETARKES